MSEHTCPTSPHHLNKHRHFNISDILTFGQKISLQNYREDNEACMQNINKENLKKSSIKKLFG